MFITLHDEDGELNIRVESIEAFYKLDEETATIRTTSQGFFNVTETIEEIKKMLMPGLFHAEWQVLSVDQRTGATLYRCSECGMESYYPFEVCPVCLSRMKKKGE